MKQVGVFLPGRLASSRLPNKLILPIGDTCLWEIACKKLDSLSDEYEKCVLVSKDDIELVRIADKFKSIEIILRSPETSLKDNPLNFVFKDIDKMESNIVMFLNPCLLFLKKESIETALHYVNSEYCYTESVKPFNSWLYADTGLITQLDLTTMNTKFVETMFQPAHAFRIFNKSKFLETGAMSIRNPGIWILENSECIDIDTQEDYEYAKYLYER